eukprot:1974948-Pleurochrysis_carterae.AAC.1
MFARRVSTLAATLPCGSFRSAMSCVAHLRKRWRGTRSSAAPASSQKDGQWRREETIAGSRSRALREPATSAETSCLNAATVKSCC